MLLQLLVLDSCLVGGFSETRKNIPFLSATPAGNQGVDMIACGRLSTLGGGRFKVAMGGEVHSKRPESGCAPRGIRDLFMLLLIHFGKTRQKTKFNQAAQCQMLSTKKINQPNKTNKTDWPVVATVFYSPQLAAQRSAAHSRIGQKILHHRKEPRSTFDWTACRADGGTGRMTSASSAPHRGASRVCVRSAFVVFLWQRGR